MSNRKPVGRRTIRMILAAIAVTAMLGACSTANSDPGGGAAGSETVTIETNLGEKTVPVNPARVVVLDNTAMETIRDLGIKPVALPKPLLPHRGFEDWLNDDSILDVGTHREPNLEVVSEAEPDLIIGGFRFDQYTDELAKIAPVIDISPRGSQHESYIEGLKVQTATLGKIFDKAAETDKVISEFDDAVAQAKAATSGQSVFLAVASGNNIDNGAGRIGAIIEPLNLVDIFAGQELDPESVHNDSGLAPETVAQANPDWAIVLDRDAAVTTNGEATPAANLFAAQQAWRNVTFMTKDQVIYLAPDFYTREGIQAYTEAYREIASAFSR